MTGAPDNVLDPAPIAGLLDTLGDAGPALAIDVINTFCSEAPRLLAAIEQAVSSHNAPDTRVAAHSLKSTAATLGAVALSDACARLELAAGAGDMAATQRLISEVQAEHQTARLALRSVAIALRTGNWKAER